MGQPWVAEAVAEENYVLAKEHIILLGAEQARGRPRNELLSSLL